MQKEAYIKEENKYWLSSVVTGLFILNKIPQTLSLQVHIKRCCSDLLEKFLEV